MPELRLKLSPTQLRFFNATARHVWLISSKGEGKSFSAIASLFAHVARQDPDNLPISVGIVRDTHENFQAHTVTSIKRDFPGLFTFKNDYHVMIGPNIVAQTYGVNDLEAVNKLQAGGQHDVVWIEEPAPILDTGNAGIREEVFFFADAVLRGGKCTKRLQITQNPANRLHWTYKQAIVAPLPDTAVFFMKPGENPYYSQADR